MGAVQRYPGFESVRNLRDLGGYSGHEGRKVKWRNLLRSGMLAHLSVDEAARLRDWQVSHVLDFRSASEKARDGVISLHDWQPRYIALPIGGNAAAWLRELYDRLLHEDFPEGEMERIFTKAYRDYPVIHAEDLGRFLRHVSETGDEEAFLFNCTAGKDRTGISAALLLSVLGVERDAIIADYMLTNIYVDIEDRAAQASQRFQDHHGRDIDPAVLTPLFGVNEDFINASFAVMEDMSGTIDRYARDHCGVTDALIERLQSRFLES